MSKKIVILDFSTAIVHIKNVPIELENEQSEIVMQGVCEEMGIREDDCQYMIGELTIEQE